MTWQITPETMDAMLNDPDKAKAERVMNAMMGMVKLISLRWSGRGMGSEESISLA